MTCDQIYDLLSAKLDGELSEREEAQLQAHLEDCKDCQRLYDAMFTIEEQTKALEQPAPAGLKRGVMYRIRQESGSTKSSKRRFWGVGTGLGLVAAALVMMVGAGIIKLPKPSRMDPKPTEKRDYSYSIEDPIKNTSAEPTAYEIPASQPSEPVSVPMEDNTSKEAPEKPDNSAADPEIIHEPDRSGEHSFEVPSHSDATEPVRENTPDAEQPSAETPVIPQPNDDPVQPEPETQAPSEPVRRPTVFPDGTESEDPAADPNEPEEPGEDPDAPLLELPQPVTDELNEACMELSEASFAPVLLYTEFSFESMLFLLEQEEPELYEALAALEPMTMDETLHPDQFPEDEDGDPENEAPEAEPVEETPEASELLPVIPEWVMPGFEGETEPLPPEERTVVCLTDYRTILALHEWMLQKLPRSLETDLELLETEAATYLRMEELDPENGSLREIITWDRFTGPVSWPEFWAKDWALRFRAAENWALFFPDRDYAPEPEEMAFLVFLAPTVEEPIPERETELDTEPETEPEK